MPEDRVRIGVQLQPQHASYSLIRQTLAAVEELGVDIAFNWDHFFPLSGDPDGMNFEGWSMLAAWAEQTSRIEFGPLVTCNSYRNPDLLADMARTIDQVSAHDAGTGRLVFAIGSGWFEKDYTEYAYPFGTAGGRLDSLSEALPRIEARWSRLNPAPTRSIPVMIGGSGEKKTLRIVAQHADIWHSFSDAPTLERKLGILRQWCETVGRDPEEIAISTGAVVRAGAGDSGLSALDDSYALGARLFTLEISGPDYDLDAVRVLLGWRDSING